MFVRWVQRERWWPEPGVRFKASLVESVRENGKVRQQHIAFLGSIRQAVIAKLWAQDEFWTAALAKLDSLALDPADRRKVLAALKARVPKPTKRAVRADERRWQKGLKGLARKLSGEAR